MAWYKEMSGFTIYQAKSQKKYIILLLLWWWSHTEIVSLIQSTIISRGFCDSHSVSKYVFP